MNRIAQNVGFNLIATLVVFITGFLTSIIGARILGPTSYGEFSYLIWILTTLVLLADLGISSATQKYVAELEGAHQRPVANSLTLAFLAIQVGVSFVIGVILLVFGPRFTIVLNQSSIQSYLPIFIIGVPIAMILVVLRARLAGHQRFDLISMVTILSNVSILISTYLLLKLGYGVRELMGLTLAVFIFQLLLYVFLVWKQHNLTPLDSIPFPLLRIVVRYCIGVLLITYIDAIVWQRSETFFLGHLSTAEEIGYYGIAYSIAGVLVTLLPIALTGILLPTLSNHFGAGDRESMQRVYSTATKYVVIVSLPLALGVIAMASPLLGIFYGTNYLSAVWPLRILLIASSVGAIAGPGSALFLALGKPYLVGLWGIPIAILNITLAYVLVPPYGAVGAAIANTTCQVLGVAVGTTYLLHFQHFRLPVNALLRTLLAASISAGIVYLVINHLTGWIGLLISVILGVTIYISALIITQVFNPSDFALMNDISNILPYRASMYIKHMVNFMEATNLWYKNIISNKLF